VIVYFESNSAKLTDKYKAVLDAAILAMGGKADSEYLVNGYADSQGPDAYNMKLSEKRTKAVVDYLKAKGLDVKRLAPNSYGEASPAATNDTPEGRGLNRRCEIILK
jgi:OOP family OmpA-OmpF porin